MAHEVTAEALARIEHKLDLLLKALKVTSPIAMHLKHGHTCPLCSEVVNYTIDPNKQVVERRCGCKTGMVPTFKLTPVIPGVKNGNTTESLASDIAALITQNGNGSKGS